MGDVSLYLTPASRAEKDVRADQLLQHQLWMIANSVARSYGFTPGDLRTRPSGDERKFLCWMLAIAISRNVLMCDFKRMARFFGTTPDICVECCNRVAEKCERDPKFKLTKQFATSACNSILFSERGETTRNPHAPH